MKTHRKDCAIALIALLTSLVAGLPSRGGTVLYQTGFEPPTFQAGSPLYGQGGFVGFGNEDVPTVSTEFPRSGSQSVKVDGALMEEFFGFVDGLYFKTFNYDPIASATPIIRISVDVALDAAPNVESLAGIQIGDQNGNTVVNFYLHSNGVAGSVSAYNLSEPVPSFLEGPAISFGQYYTLGVTLDYGARRAAFSIGGTPLGSLAFSSGTGNILGDVPLWVQGDYPLTSVAYFDNYSITAVPEPGTFAFLGMGMLAMLGYTRGRHRRPLG